MRFPLRPAVVEVLRGSGRGFVVTPNERTGRLIRQAWERQQRERGETCWEQAPVVSWRGLLRGWWDRLLVAGVATAPVLSREQEARLWQRAVHDDDDATGGSRVLPGMAARAAARLEEFRAGAAFRGMRLAEGSDAAAFARWTADVERWATELGWVTEGELAGRLVAAMRAGRLGAMGRRLVMVGFDELTPAQRMVLAAWGDAGGNVEAERFGWEAPEPRGLVCAARTAEDEVEAFARWAGERLRGGVRSIALVVPDMAAERDAIEPVLRAHLEDERRGLAGAGEAPRFEFSLGRPLRQEPMVRAAFDLLRLMRGGLPMERLGPLLQSPYVAGEPYAREIHGRSALHAQAVKRHRRVVPEIELDELRAMSLQRLSSVPGLQAAMEAMGKELGAIERRLQKQRDAAEGLLDFAGWAEVVTDWLRAAGWAGAGQPSSREFQVRRRWERLVEGMAALSFGGEAVPLGEALDVLESMAREAVFAPESQGAAVQVMGPREAAGCCFEAVWVLRAGGTRWGVRERLTPLLPVSLQEEFGMPGARVERERERGERLAERLLASGAEVVFSYAEEAEGEPEQSVAAAVRRLGLTEVRAEDLAPKREHATMMAAEMVEDRDAVAPLREGVSHGGSRVLELQAACGFRAFAELRLGAKELTEPDEGMSGKDRGTLTHAAMNLLWGALESQGTAAALSPAEREEAVAAAVRVAMEEARAGARSGWEREFLALQEQRMRRLIGRWMEHELRRPAFRVEQQETETEARIGPLLLTLRVDRVDVDEATGGRLVVDYKTGAASPAAWVGERPDQPQLPLYAVALSRAGDGEPVAGVTFAMLRPGTGMGLRGVADHKLVPTGRTRAGEDMTFAERVREWEEALEGLAEEFAAGLAHVRPKSFPKSCERCGQRVLCRIRAEDLEPEPEADDEAGDRADEQDEMTHG